MSSTLFYLKGTIHGANQHVFRAKALRMSGQERRGKDKCPLCGVARKYLKRRLVCIHLHMSNRFWKKERKEQERKGLTQQVSLLHLVTVSHRVRKYLGEQSRTFSQDGSTKGFFMGT